MSFDLNGSIFAGSSVDVNFHCLSASVPHDQRVTGIDIPRQRAFVLLRGERVKIHYLSQAAAYIGYFSDDFQK